MHGQPQIAWSAVDLGCPRRLPALHCVGSLSECTMKLLCLTGDSNGAFGCLDGTAGLCCDLINHRGAAWQVARAACSALAGVFARAQAGALVAVGWKSHIEQIRVSGIPIGVQDIVQLQAVLWRRDGAGSAAAESARQAVELGARGGPAVPRLCRCLEDASMDLHAAGSVLWHTCLARHMSWHNQPSKSIVVGQKLPPASKALSAGCRISAGKRSGF